MKNYLPVIAVLLLLTACETNQQDKEVVKAQVKEDVNTAQDNAERHTMRVANNMRNSIKRTSMKMREWWLTPVPEPVPVAVPPSYCYQVLQDIVCYRAPMPGMEHKLVGWQGDSAVPPPVAQTLSIPVSRIEQQNAAMSGAARVEAAKPVFKGIPVPAKEDSENTVLDATPQPGSEPLPDPALSPQL